MNPHSPSTNERELEPSASELPSGDHGSQPRNSKRAGLILAKDRVQSANIVN
jgi:hypothetical protein